MPRETKSALRERALEIVARLDREYPGATCALHWKTPWQLLAATILSAQCTDDKVNEITPVLFQRYKTVRDLATATPEEVEQIIRPTGFYHNKTKSLIGAAQAILSGFGGEVPQTMADLLTLPGVARKTANVVLGTAFGVAEGVVVDTHVSRLALRMALTPQPKTKSLNIEKIESDLMTLIPQDQWIKFGHCMTWHGRRVCTAKKAWCERCVVEELCPKMGVGKTPA
jgi:endonuclease-3